MNLKLVILFFFQIQIITAQTFIEKTGTPFEGVWNSSIAFSDVNGDGFEDVLITGENSLTEGVAKLYTNDGTGSFTEKMNTPFEGVKFSSIAFSDVNGDGYDDVLISGLNNSLVTVSKLYTNDGTGTFTEKINTPFDGVYGGAVAFADVNGDGHNDVLITGSKSGTASDLIITKLYINDGTGTFTEMAGTPFEGVWDSSIAFADVNSDGDKDLIITGSNIFTEPITKLYSNDGTGIFSEVMGTPFESVRAGSLSFSDVNGDGHNDLFITGAISTFLKIAKIYTNDGTGTFSELTSSYFEPICSGSIAFSDVNSDGHNDVLITGTNSMGNQLLAKLYTNDGTGTYTETPGTPIDPVRFCSIAFSDVNGDGNKDILITGSNSSGQIIAKLYINDGSSSIKDVSTEISLDFVLFPNPTQPSTLFLKYDSTEKNELTIKVYHSNGILQIQQKERTLTGQQTFSIDLTSLPKGVYFLELDNGKSKESAQFIIH